MAEYPEHEKLAARREERDAVQDFYDWLTQEQGIVLSRPGAPKERTLTCPRCDGTGIDQRAMTGRQKQLLRRSALREEEWPKCERCEGRRKIIEEYVDHDKLFPIREKPEDLIAGFFEIDVEAFFAEKDAMLAAIRKMNEKSPA
jgi:hypothetical protein